MTMRWIVLVGATMWVGCSGTAQRPSVSELQPGLNMLDVADPMWGTSSAYVKDGRVVYMETRLGLLKPEVYRGDSPDEPAYEMDMRIVDQNGSTFYVQRGGDNYIEPTWGAEFAQSMKNVNVKERELDWKIALEATADFAKVAPASLRDHSHTMKTFATMRSPVTDTAMRAQMAARPAGELTNAETGYGSYSRTGWTQTYIGKYSKGAGCFAWICGGSHTATQLWVNPNVGYWIASVNACNHGTCAGASGMSYDCNTPAVIHSSSFAYNGSTATGVTGASDGLGGCQTKYNWNSGGTDHLCNDDAVFEMAENAAATGSVASSTYYRAQNGFCRGSACGGGSPAHYACNCGVYGCSGDWNTPNCF